MPELSTINDLRQACEVQTVPVRAAGLELRARTPTAREWAAVKHRMIASQRADSAEAAADSLAEADCLLLSQLCDAEGRRWLTDDDIDAMADANGVTIGLIANAILEATGLDGDDLVQTAKNSSETSGDASATA